MILNTYISFLGLHLNRSVSPSAGTHYGQLSVGLLPHPAMAKKSTGNSGLEYAFRVRKAWEGHPCVVGLYKRMTFTCKSVYFPLVSPEGLSLCQPKAQ
jgi:hypothetical protein